MYQKVVKIAVLLMMVVAALASAAGTQESSTEKEPITLTIWWWGEQEAPGAEAWMKETIAEFQQENPGIRVQSVLQETDGLAPTISAAMEAGDGADIVGNWAGVDTFDMMIKGHLIPLDDLLPSEVVKNTMLKELSSFEGKLYAVPFYRGTHGMIYNKGHFRKAGLETNWNPRNGQDMIDTWAKLKSSGITPFSAGLKDWFGDWWYGPLGAQYLDGIEDMRALFTKEADFTESKYWKWLEMLSVMAEEGYINEDAGGLDAYTGTVGVFGAGQSGTSSVPDTLLTTFATDMGADAFGFIPFPPIGNGALKNNLPFWSSSAFGIAHYCEHPNEAAQFVAYMRTPERLEAFYKQTGQFPADLRLKPQGVTTPYDQSLMDMRVNLHTMEPTFWADIVLPRMVQEQGIFPATNRVALGEITPEEGGKIIQDALEKWMNTNPEMVSTWADLLK
jgi:multiple sugar transport system substrate-binding protein